VLTCRLRGVIGNLISKNKSAFVRGRQISDAALIASEVINSRTKFDKPTSHMESYFRKSALGGGGDLS